MDNAETVTESDIRHRNVETIPTENSTDYPQSDITLNRIETMSSSNELFWTILIISLIFAIIVLILRRLFLV
jgi:hypothetical protein